MSQWRRTAFTIGLNGKVLALHRRRFLAFHSKPEFAHSVATTVTCADKILEAVKELELAGAPGRRWWLVTSLDSYRKSHDTSVRGILVHAYKACVALLIDHQHRLEADPKAQLSETRAARISAVIGTLRYVVVLQFW